MNPKPRTVRNVQRTEVNTPFVLVRPLEDRRPLRNRESGQALGSTAFKGSTWGAYPCPEEQLFITHLFVSALRFAGFDSAVYLGSGRPVHPTNAPLFLLEGQVWEFHFESEAGIPCLAVDLSLSLRDLNVSTLLWKSDFPTEEELPTWIGLGCGPEPLLDQALREVVDSAVRDFQSTEFTSAVGQPAGSKPPLPRTSEITHAIVTGSSWTGTEEGEIQATAHESAPLFSSERIPTDDSYVPIPTAAGKA